MSALMCLLFAASPLAAWPEHESGAAPNETETEAADLEATAAEKAENACAMNDQGLAWFQKGLFDEAEEAFKESLRLVPDAGVYNNLGSLYLTTRRNSSAKSAFKNALRLDPNFALAHYNMGVVHDAEGDPDDAFKSYKRALDLDPSLADVSVNPQALHNRYLLAVRLERYRTMGALALPMISCDEAPATATTKD
jgi:tetratricopeptide (TPR) repeat protein